MNMMLDVVKKAVRISHSALDDELEDLIEASRYDLKLSVFLISRQMMTLIL